MHLRRKLFKLAAPMVLGYFIDPQLGADRRRRIVSKAQRMLGKAPALDDQGRSTENPSQPTVAVVSETISERLVVTDGNGRVVGDTSSRPAVCDADKSIDAAHDRLAVFPAVPETQHP